MGRGATRPRPGTAETLFALLCEAFPGRYQEGQLRTLQRQVQAWRVRRGPEQEVMFPQEHLPGRMAQSDFTSMNALGIGIAGTAFPHLVYHLVLTYSNVEAVRVCFSESFEALAEGVEGCLWQIGGVPAWHRTDNLSAAVRDLDREGLHEFTQNYRALMAHYGMQPSANTAGMAHQNGDVEQSHFRFKQAVDQALRVRGSRDFADRGAYERFLAELVRQRNLTRTARFDAERAALRPLPTAPLDFTRELTVRVSRFSLVRVLLNHYSVPSRARAVSRPGAGVDVAALGGSQSASDRLPAPDLVVGTQAGGIRELLLPRGAVSDHHLSARIRRLLEVKPTRADAEYLRLLHLAASTSETAVELAITRLLDAGSTPTFDTVRDLAGHSQPTMTPDITKATIDFTDYDALIASRSHHA